MANRAKIEQVNRWTVRLTTPEGNVRDFWIPHTTSGRGYVREGRSNPANAPQVCEGLAHRGNTLETTPEALIEVIRREWKKARREDAAYT